MLKPIPNPTSQAQADDKRRATQRDIAELAKLLDSRGWAIIHEVMTAEMHDAAIGLASSAIMAKDEIDFRRGTIWAAKQLLDLPAKLMAIRENELLFLPPANPTSTPQASE